MMEGRRLDLLITAAAAAIVIATIALAALIPALPRNEGPSTAAYGDSDRSCAEWSDGCVVCIRTDQGPSCSTPGIACTRSALRCTARVP
jgi:hypothetical protein